MYNNKIFWCHGFCEIQLVSVYDLSPHFLLGYFFYLVVYDFKYNNHNT